MKFSISKETMQGWIIVFV